MIQFKGVDVEKRLSLRTSVDDSTSQCAKRILERYFYLVRPESLGAKFSIAELTLLMWAMEEVDVQQAPDLVLMDMKEALVSHLESKTNSSLEPLQRIALIEKFERLSEFDKFHVLDYAEQAHARMRKDMAKLAEEEA